MDVDAYYRSEFDEHRLVVEVTARAMAEPFSRLVQLSVQTIKAGGKLMFFGNGGSAADAQHLAPEL